MDKTSSTLYTSLPHDLIKAKVLSLVKWCSTESQKRTSVRQIRRDFSPRRYMTRIHVGLALRYVKFVHSSWKSIPANSGDSYGH